MPDGRTSDARPAQREAHVADIVARCGNIYTHFRLSPPMALRAAAEHWVGLSLDEIACVVEDNLIAWEFPRLCRGGSRSLTYTAVGHPGNLRWLTRENAYGA